MEQFETLTQSLALFSSLSGLSFEHLIPDETNPCFTCIAHDVTIMPKVTIVLCHNGFCRLVLLYDKAVYMSSPVSFSARKTHPCSHMTSPVLHMTPAGFYKTAKLFSFTFTGKEINPLAARLSAELSDCLFSPAQTQTFIQSVLPKIVSENGNHFAKNKYDLLCFILSLYELAEPYGGAVWKEGQLSALTKATSMGHLASCANEAVNRFTEALFPNLDRKHAELVQNACLFISQNYHKRLTQNQVAHSIYVSPSYFSKIFKDSLGCSFNQYINHLRISKAKELLAVPLIKIEDVSGLVGYESRSYFGKIFRNLTGKTPKEYRDSVIIR